MTARAAPRLGEPDGQASPRRLGDSRAARHWRQQRACERNHEAAVGFVVRRALAMQSDLGEHDKMSARGGLRLAPDAIESVCRRLQRKATFRNGTWVDLAEHTAALRSVYSPPSAQPARCSAEGEDEIVRRLFRAHVDEKRQSAEALQRRLEGEDPVLRLGSPLHAPKEMDDLFQRLHAGRMDRRSA